MFAVIQFPIADARGFGERGDLAEDHPDRGQLRLRRPDFANLKWNPPPEYLRYFGRAVERPRGRQSAWIDERAFCRADRAIRYVDLHQHPLAADGVTLAAASAFRRVFGDGNAVVRVELGIRAPTAGDLPSGLTGAQCGDLVRSFVLLPTKVRAVTPRPAPEPAFQAPAALVRQGNHLARLFRQATAAKLPADELEAHSRLVKSGVPLVVAEFETDEAAGFPDGAFVVDPAAVGGARLAFAYVRYGRDDTIPTWFLQPGTADNERRRNIRLALLRLHAQRQTLNLILHQVRQGFVVMRGGSAAGARLEQYLNTALSLVETPKSFGVSQPELWRGINDAEAAEAALGFASHTVDLAQGAIGREDLLSQLGAAKGQLQRRIGAYAGGTRPGTPLDPIDSLVEILTGLPATSQFLGRGSLLAGIPGGNAINRDEHNQAVDLSLIVSQVFAQGPLDSGVHPLAVLIDNALPFAGPGAAAYAQLQSIRATLAPA